MNNSKNVKKKKSELLSSFYYLKKKSFFSLLFLFTTGVAIFYTPIITMKGVIWNDFIEQYLPYRIFATNSLKKFVFPFWNPYCFSGMPFFADIQSAVLYPLNLLMVLFSNKDGFPVYLFELQILFHLILAGLFTYILSRDFQRSRSASIFAAFIFMFGGFATGHIFHVTMIHTLPYFPAALFTLRRALTLKSLKYIVATSLCICMAAFAGHPQMYLYLHYLLSGYFLYHIILLLWQKNNRVKEIGIASLLFFLAIGTGNGLSSVQLLPTYKLSKESVRPKMDLKESAQGSFRFYRFITLISPNFYSTPNSYRKEIPSYWGLTEKDVDPGAHYYWETMLYIGILPLIFFIISLFSSRSPPVIFLLCILLSSFLIAMGDTTPFYTIAYNFLPGIKMFRNPCRIGVLCTLSMSLLAAYGFDKIIKNDRKFSPAKRNIQIIIGTGFVIPLFVIILFYAGAFKATIQTFIMNSKIFGDNLPMIERYVTEMIYPFVSKQILISGIFIILNTFLLLAYLYSKINKRIFIISALLLTFIDLIICEYGFGVIKINPAVLYKKNQLINSIQKELKSEFFRINSRSAKPGSDEIGGAYMLFRRNEGWVHDMFLVEGYNPLRLKRELIDRKPRTLDILNVKYKIDVDESKNSMGIVLHPTYLPRARIVNSYRLIRDEKQILATLHSKEFNHINEIILEEEPPIKLSSTTIDKTEDKAEIISYSLNKIVTEVDTKEPAFLVLSEIYYPSWKAYVDGQKTKVFCADYALRAIPIPDGKHIVICKYEDDAFKIGLTFSLISFGALLLLAFLPKVLKHTNLKIIPGYIT